MMYQLYRLECERCRVGRGITSVGIVATNGDGICGVECPRCGFQPFPQRRFDRNGEEHAMVFDEGPKRKLVFYRRKTKQ